MIQNNIKEENFIKTISEYFEIIPYLKNNKYDNKNYEIKSSNYYEQSFYNNLISLYNKNYVYSPINNIINSKILNFYSENYEQNLYLNIRNNNYESTFKYILGYKPINTKLQRYYFFKKISPNNVNEKEDEYLYVDSDFYKDLIIPEELQKIGKSKSMIKNLLLNVPLFLKYYEKIFCYVSNIQPIKDNIISELKKINCIRYANMFEKLTPVKSKTILKENKDEYFYMLTGLFLDKEYNKIELDNETIGYMLYNIIKNKNLCSLNLHLPKIIEVDTVNFNVKKIEDNVLKNKKVKFNKARTIQEYFGKDYIPVTISEKKTYDEILSKGFENLFSGGYINDLMENNKIIAKIKDIENVKDDKIITTQTILPTMKSINEFKLENIHQLEKLLFGHIVIDENFYNSNEYKKDLHKIYEMSNKKINVITYNLDDFEFNIFSLNTINDEKNFIQIYMYYFNIIKNMCSFIVNNTNNQKTDIDFIIYNLGLMVLKTLDIIGKLAIDDILAFRYYMEYYYNVLNTINKKLSYVAIIPYINILIENYNENIIRKFVGGESDTKIKIFDINNFYNFDYFSYSYTLDVLCHLTEENNYNPEFYLYMDNRENIFWDGIPYEEYVNKSNNEKLVKSVVCYTMFINETVNGDKMSFKMIKDNKIKRVCFLPKLINDKNTVIELLKKLTSKLDRDVTYEKNIETFLSELNIILKNIDVTGLIKKFNKVDTPDKALALTNYIKNNENNLKSNNTFLDLLVFLVIFLNKLGFTVVKNFSKTNLNIEIEPALNKENILKYLTKEGQEKYTETYKKFIEENSDIIDFLMLNTVNNNNYEIGGGDENKSNIILDLNTSLYILENNISDKILTSYENNNENDNTILNVYENEFLKDDEEIFKQEKDNLKEEIKYLLNLDELTDKNLYRILPNYIKNQYKLFNNENFLDTIFEKKFKGGNQEHPIDNFLKKIKTYNTNTCTKNMGLSTEKINETINLILNERFLKNLNNNTLLYYDNMLFNNDKNVYKIALYNTIKNFEYLKNVYKINVTNEIKESLFNLLSTYTETEQYIYQIFIISEYIKKFITYMYQKLGMEHDEYEFNYENFLDIYRILKCKFKEKDENNKKLYEYLEKNNLQKLSMEKTQYKYKNVSEEKLTDLLKNNTNNSSI